VLLAAGRDVRVEAVLLGVRDVLLREVAGVGGEHRAVGQRGSDRLPLGAVSVVHGPLDEALDSGPGRVSRTNAPDFGSMAIGIEAGPAKLRLAMYSR
jgi:hypothetical protein